MYDIFSLKDINISINYVIQSKKKHVGRPKRNTYRANYKTRNAISATRMLIRETCEPVCEIFAPLRERCKPIRRRRFFNRTAREPIFQMQSLCIPE